MTKIDISDFLDGEVSRLGYWWYIKPEKLLHFKAFLALAGLDPKIQIWSHDNRPIIIRETVEKKLNANRND